MLETVPVVVASVARAFSCPPKASRSPTGRSHLPAHAKYDPSLGRSGACRFIIKVLEKAPWCTTGGIMYPSSAHTDSCFSRAHEPDRRSQREARQNRRNRPDREKGEGTGIERGARAVGRNRPNRRNVSADGRGALLTAPPASAMARKRKLGEGAGKKVKKAKKSIRARKIEVLEGPVVRSRSVRKGKKSFGGPGNACRRITYPTAQVAVRPEVGAVCGKAKRPPLCGSGAQVRFLPQPSVRSRLVINRESGALIRAGLAGRAFGNIRAKRNRGETARRWMAGSSPCPVPMGVRKRGTQQRLRDRGQT